MQCPRRALSSTRLSWTASTASFSTAMVSPSCPASQHFIVGQNDRSSRSLPVLLPALPAYLPLWCMADRLAPGCPVQVSSGRVTSSSMGSPRPWTCCATWSVLTSLSGGWGGVGGVWGGGGKRLKCDSATEKWGERHRWGQEAGSDRGLGGRCEGRRSDAAIGRRSLPRC